MTPQKPVQAEELVDVVDEKDNVLCQMPREQAETERRRLRGTQVFVTNADGAFFVQWRAAGKKVYPRTFTASAAGLAQAHETYEAAAQRELKEELGIEAALVRVGAYQLNGNRPLNGMLYTAAWDGDVTGWEEEADALDLWTVEEAAFMMKRFPYLLAPTFLECLKIYLKWRKKNGR